jgi:type II secretory pathway pseudopilin PulG
MTAPNASNLAPPTTPMTVSATRTGRGGFTMVEMVLSVIITSILLLAMSSAMMLASKAVPSATSAVRQGADSNAAFEQLRADIACATSVTELTATAITVTVADRGHGAAGEETIRWSWSGVSGAPLTRSYNGSTPTTTASNVTAFALTPEYVAGVLTSPPKVLMVVSNPASLTSDDNARVAKLTAWAFPVTLIDADATQAQFDAAYALCDVLYLPDDTVGFMLPVRIGNPSIGIVCEQDVFYGVVGVSSLAAINNHDRIEIKNNTHVITSGFSTGNLAVTSRNVDLHVTSGTNAPDLQVLADQEGTSNNPILAVIECNGNLVSGQAARSRRVVLPWGGTRFNPLAFSDLPSNARTILKRSLVWAAAPSQIDAVKVQLTIGSGAASVSNVELLSRPRAIRP